MIQVWRVYKKTKGNTTNSQVLAGKCYSAEAAADLAGQEALKDRWVSIKTSFEPEESRWD